MDRRTVLRYAIVAGTAGLAGCAGGNGGDGEGGNDGGAETPESTPEPTESPEPTPAGTPTPQPTEMATPTPESTATNTPEPTPTETPTPTPEPTPEADRTVEVGPDGRFRFSPESFEVDAGATVRWVWRAGGHNVKPSSVPDGADWSGTPGEEFETFGEGHTYAHTFEVAGEYEYYCAPHRSSGMVGSFTVR